jgi:hypothetical protein
VVPLPQIWVDHSIRKKGKLPSRTIGQNTPQYGVDTIGSTTPSGRPHLLIDDRATGGTAGQQRPIHTPKGYVVQRFCN